MADRVRSSSARRHTAKVGSGGDRNTGPMQGLLSEFRGLYENKLRRLDEAERAGEVRQEDTQKTRLRILQSYVNDLSEQNEVLVQTVEELEKEANDRVAILESKLNKTGATVKEYMTKAREYERDVKAANIEKDKVGNALQDIQERYEETKHQCALLKEDNSNLKHDVNILINVISGARTHGRWEIDDIRFRAINFEQVFGSWNEIAKTKSSEEILESHIKELKIQLQQRDDVIDRLRQEIIQMKQDHRSSLEMVHEREKSLGAIQTNLSTAQQREQAATNASTEKDINIMRIKSDLRLSQEKTSELQRELQSKERKVMSLQTEITDLLNQLAVKDSENANNIKSMQLVNEKSKESTRQLAQCEETIRRLKDELGYVKDDHARSTRDVGQYEKRIKQLEEDLLKSKQDSRGALEEIGKLQSKLRDSQVSSHDHHEILKEELSRRDETIQKLRMENLHLQEKRDHFQAELDRHERRAFELEKQLEQDKRKADEETRKIDDKCRRLQHEVDCYQKKGEHHQAQINAQNAKVSLVEKELETVRAQHADSLMQVQKLTTSLQKLQGSSKDTRDALTAEVAERHDAILKLKNDAKELEEKHREALATVNHRGEVIRQLRDEIKQSNQRVFNELVIEHVCVRVTNSTYFSDKFSLVEG